jgi:hypothetical protein
MRKTLQQAEIVTKFFNNYIFYESAGHLKEKENPQYL